MKTLKSEAISPKKDKHHLPVSTAMSYIQKAILHFRLHLRVAFKLFYEAFTAHISLSMWD